MFLLPEWSYGQRRTHRVEDDDTHTFPNRLRFREPEYECELQTLCDQPIRVRYWNGSSRPTSRADHPLDEAVADVLPIPEVRK
jgi:hypothetical protein